MSSRDQRDQTLLEGLVNEDEHHSIGLAGRARPSGRKMARAPVAGKACLARIEDIRTGLRPRSLPAHLGTGAR
jgi:uncharacterized protein YbdZ (MbtH family)